MSITIRSAVAADIQAVRYVGTVAWPATYGPDRGAEYVMSGLDEFWSAEAISDAIRAGHIDVAESAHGILGMTHVDELGDDLVMWKLYVLPNHQGQRIGKLLTSAAKDRARSTGKDLLTEYERSNERVRGFYLREGFSETTAPWPGTEAIWLRWTADLARDGDRHR